MRHEQLRDQSSFETVDLAVIWPNGINAQGPVGEIEASVRRGTTAVPDMPRAAGIMLVGVYVALMVMFALTLAGDRSSTFAIVISALYVAMFLGVPAVFLRVEQDRARRPRLSEFLENGIETANGPISGAGALVQMLIVPGLLTLAIAAMGIIASVTQ